MSDKIDIQIKVPGKTKYLKLISRIGENMAREMDCFPGDREAFANRLNVVLTEATVNAIKHANTAEPDKEIVIRIRVSEQEICIGVHDCGKGFDLSQVTAPNFDTSSLEEKGRGIFIIRSLMDSVEYKKDNGGNVLEMKKRLG